MTNPARVWHALTLLGYFGTFVVLVAWYAWLSPSTHFPIVMILLVLCLPLLLPLRGLLHGKTYTVQWSLFLAVAYFTHGVVEAYSVSVARNYALVEVVCTLLWFVAGIAFVRSSRIK